MKFISLLLILLSAALAPAAVPEYQRNDFTTNLNPTARGIVTNIARSVGIMYISPPGGNNALTDMMTNAPSFVGQPGIGQDSANAGHTMHLFGAGATSTGSNGWGIQWVVPPLQSIGEPYPWQSPQAYVISPKIYVNANPGMASRSNILSGASLKDPSLFYHQYNPYGHATFCFPGYTTNDGYAYNGTNSALVGYTTDGKPFYTYDPFGLTIGTIHPEWIAGETNQAGAMALILGGLTSNPFHISGNNTVGGSVGQYPFLTIDRRGFTNAGKPIAVGVPMLVANAWEPTNTLWRWAIVTDPRDGSTYITNGLLTLTNVLINGTKAGNFIAGGNYDSSTPFNVNVSASFNAPGGIGAYTNAWTFDAAEAHRVGFVTILGDFTHLAHGTNSQFYIGVANVTDLHTRPQTIKKQMVFGNLAITNNDATYFAQGIFNTNGNTLSIPAWLQPSGNEYLSNNAASTRTTLNLSNSYVTFEGASVGNSMKVGINTNATLAGFGAALTDNLQVNGTFSAGNNRQMTISSGGAVNINSDTGNQYTFRVQTNHLVVTNGNVGIGTNAPGGALDVQGNALVSGTLNVSGASTMNNAIFVSGNSYSQSGIDMGSLGGLTRANYVSIGTNSTSLSGILKIRQVTTNSIAIFDGALSQQFRIETNGPANYSTQATNQLVATGYTNTTGVNMQAIVSATAVSFTINDRSGTVIYTSPSLTATVNVGLQPSWSVRAASGLAGTVIPGL